VSFSLILCILEKEEETEEKGEMCYYRILELRDRRKNVGHTAKMCSRKEMANFVQRILSMLRQIPSQILSFRYA